MLTKTTVSPIGSKRFKASAWSLKSVLYIFLLLMPAFLQAQNWAALGKPDFTGSGANFVGIGFDGTDNPYLCTGGTVWKFSNGSWSTVGNPNSTYCTNELYYSFAVDKNGISYVSGAPSFDSTVVFKYSGDKWSVLGNKFTPVVNGKSLMILDGNGTPYIVLTKSLGNNAPSHLNVYKYNGSKWDSIGPGLSGMVSSFAIDGNGVIYLSYYSQQKGYLLKYSGGHWTQIGTSFSPADYGNIVSMAFNSSNTPFIVFPDAAANGDLSVMSFNGSGWNTMGKTGITGNSGPNGCASYNIVFDKSDNPYVLYGTPSHKSGVLKYNGNSWVNLGGTFGGNYREAPFTSQLGFDSKGKLYAGVMEEPYQRPSMYFYKNIGCIPTTSMTTITTKSSSYTFNGATYNASGKYVAHLSNKAGCDSAATLNLTIIPGIKLTMSASSNNNIQAHWNLIDKHRYVLHYKISSVNIWLTKTVIKDSQFVITAPKAGQTYQGYVTDSTGTVMSNFAVYNVPGSVCNETAPVIISHKVTTNSDSISWTGSAPYYRVYYKTYADVNFWGKALTTSNSVKIKTLAPNTGYDFMILDSCKGGYGYSSKIDTIRTLRLPIKK